MFRVILFKQWRLTGGRLRLPGLSIQGGVLCRAAAVVPVSQALYILPAFSNSLRLPSSAAAAAALLAFSALRSSYRGKVLAAVLPIKLKER